MAIVFQCPFVGTQCEIALQSCHFSFLLEVWLMSMRHFFSLLLVMAAGRDEDGVHLSPDADIDKSLILNMIV